MLLTRVKKNYRRLGAFLLSLAMVATNVMTAGLGTAYAAESASAVRYVIDEQELQDAITAAKESGDLFDFGWLAAEEDQNSLGEYRKLLGSDTDEVYELSVRPWELLPADGAEVRVLYHAGTDRVILLFINAGEETMAFRAQIGNYITQIVQVKSAMPAEEAYGAGFGAGGAGLGAGGSVVKETDADGNIIGEDVLETDADGNIIGGEKMETDADGNPAGGMGSETDEDDVLDGDMPADDGLQEDETSESDETEEVMPSDDVSEPTGSETNTEEADGETEKQTEGPQSPAPENEAYGSGQEANGVSSQQLDADEQDFGDNETAPEADSGADEDDTGTEPASEPISTQPSVEIANDQVPLAAQPMPKEESESEPEPATPSNGTSSGSLSGGGSGGGAAGAFRGGGEYDPLAELSEEERAQYKVLLSNSNTHNAEEKIYPALSIDDGMAYARAVSIPAKLLGVEEDYSELMQAVLEMIGALPSAEEISVAEESVIAEITDEETDGESDASDSGISTIGNTLGGMQTFALPGMSEPGTEEETSAARSSFADAMGGSNASLESRQAIVEKFIAYITEVKEETAETREAYDGLPEAARTAFDKENPDEIAKLKELEEKLAGINADELLAMINAENAAAVLTGADGTFATYFSLQEAIDQVPAGAAADSTVIHLLTDVKENIMSKGKSYTLDMDGYIIEAGKANDSVYSISGGTVVINNGILRGGYMVRAAAQNNWRTVKNGMGLHIEGAANVTVNSVTITDNRIEGSASGESNLYGLGVYVSGGSDVTMTGCTISDNVGDYRIYGIGLAVDGAELTMNDCTISGNRSDYMKQRSSKASNTNTGTVYLQNGAVLNGNGLKILDNYVDYKGGAVCSKDSTLNLTDSEINGNSVDTASSGTYVFEVSGGNVALKNVEISSNISRSTGGSLYVSGANSLALDGVTFSGNNEGIQISAPQSCSLTNVTVENHELASSGDLINISSSAPVTIKGMKVSDNTVKGYSLYKRSVLHFTGSGQKLVEDSEFTGNKVTDGTNGATITVEGGAADIVNTKLTGNIGRYAGGIYALSAGGVNVKGCTISGNSGNNAGGIYADKTVTVEDTVIKENTLLGKATQGAGGIYVPANAVFKMTSGAVYDNKIAEGTNVAYDVMIYSNGTADILAPADMTDGEKDFTDYGWLNTGTNVFEDTISGKTTTTKSLLVMSAEANWLAKIGDGTFTTLKGAIEAAQPGDIIVLNQERRQIPTERLSINKDVTIDLNGAAIKGTGLRIGNGDSVLNVKSGTLTLKGTGSILANTDNAYKINVAEGAHLVLDGDIALADGGTSLSAPLTNGGTVDINGKITGAIRIFNKGILNVNAHVNTLSLGVSSKSMTTWDGKSAIYLSNTVDEIKIVSMIRGAYLTAKEGFKADKVTISSWTSGITTSEWTDENSEPDPIPIIRGKIEKLPEVTWSSKPKSPFVIFDLVDDPDKDKNAEFDKAVVLCKVEAGERFLYVDPKGVDSDENDGFTVDKPLKSLKKAIDWINGEGKDSKKHAVKDIYLMNALTEDDFKDIATWPEGVRLVRESSYRGTMIKATKELTLENMTIDGGYADSAVTAEAAMIEVSGNLTLKNVTLQNNVRDTSKNPNIGGGALYITGAGAKVKMNGGEIKNNSAVFGGGVAISRGTFTMEDGTIEENTASSVKNWTSSGGGVFVSYGGDFIMKGGTIRGNTASQYSTRGGNGGGVGVGAENTAYSDGTPQFHMNGGSIVKNIATGQGGGIYIQADCEAHISAGEISYNECYSHTPTGGLYGGGGIYVNGWKDNEEHKVGGLYLTNVEITGNTAASNGGAIAACPSSKDYIYMKNGGAIYDNTVNGKKYDIYVNFIQIGGMGGWVNVSNDNIRFTSFDGEQRPYHWKYVDSGKEVPVNHLDDIHSWDNSTLKIYTDLEEPTKEYAVKMTGNKSATSGGAIGTNGTLRIGDQEEIEMTLQKEWEYGELTEEQLQSLKIPTEVVINVYRGVRKSTSGTTGTESASNNAAGIKLMAYNGGIQLLNGAGIDPEKREPENGNAQMVADWNDPKYADIDWGAENVEDREPIFSLVLRRTPMQKAWNSVTFRDFLKKDAEGNLYYYYFEEIMPSDTSEDEMGKNQETEQKIQLADLFKRMFEEGSYGGETGRMEVDDAMYASMLTFAEAVSEFATIGGYRPEIEVDGTTIRIKNTPISNLVLAKIVKTYGRQDEDTDKDVTFQIRLKKDGKTYTPESLQALVGDAQETTALTPDASGLYSVNVNVDPSFVKKDVDVNLDVDLDRDGNKDTVKVTAYMSFPVILLNLESGVTCEIVELGGEEAHNCADAVYVGYNDRGSLLESKSAGFELTEGENSVVFQNRYDAGDLELRKRVVVPEGVKLAELPEFEFTVEVKPANGRQLHNGQYDAVRTDSAGEVTYEKVDFVNGVASVTLQDGESLRIPGLPADADFTVKEKAQEDYTESYRVLLPDQNANGKTDEDEVLENCNTGKIQINTVVVVETENRIDTGSLELRKTVVSDTGEPLSEEEKNTEFHFDVTFRHPYASEMKVLVDGQERVLKLTKSGELYEGSIDDLALKADEKRTITNLLAGTQYTVSEKEIPEGYYADYGETGAAEAAGQIQADQTAVVSVTNHHGGDNPPPPSDNPPPPSDNPPPPGDNPPPPSYTPPATPEYPSSNPPTPTTPVTNIPDEPTPLSGLETILDEDVPLAFMAPMTGDEKPVGAAALFGLVALGMMGIFGILGRRKNEEDA